MRYLSVLAILYLSIINANAGVFQNLDKLLLEEEIVDKDYVYIDTKLAYQAFRIMNNTIAATLPVNINSYTEATSVIFTPYMGSFYYTVDMDLSGEDIETMRESLTEHNYIKNLCDNVYDAKFQRANSFVLNAFFRDTEGKMISKVVLDKNTCSRRDVYYADLFD